MINNNYNNNNDNNNNDNNNNNEFGNVATGNYFFLNCYLFYIFFYISTRNSWDIGQYNCYY